VKLAEEIGFPVVLKLYSETITHKTDVGGVQLNLRNAAAVQKAWRFIEDWRHQVTPAKSISWASPFSR
jgi:acetyltransferase